MMDIKSEAILDIAEEDRLPYITKEIFKSEWIIGKIKIIKTRSDGSKYMFVKLINPLNISMSYKLDGVNWEIFGNVPKGNCNLQKDDLIYFKIEKSNSSHEKQIIQISNNTINKVISYVEFLEKAGFDASQVILDGSVAVEKLGDSLKLWATSEFFNSFELLHRDFLEEIKLQKLEIKDLETQDDELKKAIDLKQLKLSELEDRTKKLMENLEKFGVDTKSIIGPEGNLTEREADYEDISIKEIIEKLSDYIKEVKGLEYSENIIRRFFAAVQSDELIILSGPSGTGKTSLVNAFAEAVGGESRIIPVKPSWTEPEDLIGFYNPMERSYISTPFLDALIEAKLEENRDRLFLICLDEMNLAHIEYYFAEFLSKLESNKEKPFIELYGSQTYREFLTEIVDTIDLLTGDKVDKVSSTIKQWCLDNNKEYPNEAIRFKKQIEFLNKYPSKFEIPKNVRFVGTVNIDQTTKSISPKIVDRSFIIELPSNKLSDISLTQQNSSINLDALKAQEISSELFQVSKENEVLSEEFIGIKNSLIRLNEDFLETLGVEFDFRSLMHIEKYLMGMQAWDVELEVKELMGDLVYMKLLPRMNIGFSSRNSLNMEAWSRFTENIFSLGIKDLNFKIEKMNKIANDDNILSFWGGY